MHGCILASIVLVNAEVDFMGSVIESGGSVGIRASLQRAIVEKVQAELRQEYDVREVRRRELDFLEKGGDPLDFRFGDTSSFSVQSTSRSDQCPELEENAGFAFNASLHGDSVEGSGRPGAISASEPNSDVNLILFSGGNYSIDGDKVSAYHGVKNATLIEHLLHLDGNQNANEMRVAATPDSRRKSYRRRGRSRPTRGGARSSSLDVMLSHGGNGISIPSFHETIVLDKQDHKILSNGELESTTCANTVADCKMVSSDTQLGAELDIVRAVKSTNDPNQDHPPDNVKDGDVMENLNHCQQKLEPMLHVLKSPVEQSSEQTESFRAQEVVFVKALESPLSVPIGLLVNQASSSQTKGYNSANGDLKSSPNSGKNNDPDAKNLDSESLCNQSIFLSDGINDMEMCTRDREGDRNGNVKPSCILYGNESVQVCQVIQEKKEIKADVNFTHLNDECVFLRQNHKEDGLLLKTGKGSASDLEKETENENRNHGEVKDQNIVESMDVDGIYRSEVERKINTSLVGTTNTKIDDVSSVGPQGSTSNVPKLLETAIPAGVRVTNIAFARLTSSANVVPSTADEDLILEEAQIIEAKHRLIAQFPVSSLSMCYHKKSHWDFVLEEMAWLANDFAQERLWKVTAASQVCRQASFVSCSRFGAQNSYLESKKAAHFMATTVVKFWQSLEQTNQEQKLQWCNKDYSHALLDYAMRFQIHNHGVLQVEDQVTPYRMSNPGIMDMPSSNNLPEENIFYKVLPGAIEKCRNSFESHVKYEKGSCNMQEEAKTTTCNAIKVGILGNCPASNLNVSFSTKRVRTSNRQRVLSPFSVGTSASVLVPTKVDSADLSGLNNLKVESVEDFEKQLLYDNADFSSKSNNKKKAKRLDSTYEPRWQADSNYQNDQKDLSKKRPNNSHRFESNGLFGQYNAKKHKIMRQPTETSIDNSAQAGRSAPSPVASQNSNPYKLGKYFGVRDRGRKNKGLKVPVQLDSGNKSPWSLFEDQALVVLVHDLGPNWHLISDAINRSLQFKSIFRKPKECKEHYKQLMDRPACDGAESSEDSGSSSQSYSCTLPGIPKGSARRLFQRLQGPMEEDTLKSHFDKIIIIGQKLHFRRKQEPKQIHPPHCSHMVSLTQISPNNLNGGPILTPLDLIEETLDVLPLGYQGPHSGGLPFYNQTLPCRNSPQTNISSSGTLQGKECGGGHMLLGGTNGINRNLSISRPGFTGTAGTMMSSTCITNVYTGPCDSLHMMQPSQNQEIQMTMSQGIPPFGVQISSPPLPSYSPHQHHAINSHLQATNHVLAKVKPLPQKSPPFSQGSVGKQRRQPQLQSNPQGHKKQRQSQSHKKLVKVKGNNTAINPTLPIEPIIPNGFSSYSGSPMNHVRSGKPLLVPSSSVSSSPLAQSEPYVQRVFNPNLHWNSTMLQGTNPSEMPKAPNGVTNLLPSSQQVGQILLGHKYPSDSLPPGVHDVISTTTT